VSFSGLISSHSISFFSSNYAPNNHQAFASEDDSSSDDSSSSSSDDSRSSSSDDSRSSSSDDSRSSTDSFASPQVEAPLPPPPTMEESNPALIAPPSPPAPTCEQGSTLPECANVPESSGPPVQSINAPLPIDESGSTPPAKDEGDDTGGGTSIGFIPISSPNPDNNKEDNAMKQSVATPNAQTDATNEDAFQRGVKDANRDLQRLNGHGYDDSCPKGNTAAFCEAYKQGYTESYYDTPTPAKPTPITQSHPDDDCLFNPSLSKCKSIDGQCPKGFFSNDDDNCVLDKKCPKGFEIHEDEETGTCHPAKGKVDCTKNPKDPSCTQQQKPRPPSCPKDSKLVNGKCQYVGTPEPSKTVIIVKPRIDTITKNIIVNNVATAPSQGKQPSILLLLDTAQLCQLAGDTQCVAKQNQFKTLNLVTKLDSTGKSWTISGQTENIAAATKTQRNVQMVLYFYNSKGDNISGTYKGAVSPVVLKSLQTGVFNFKASATTMKGTPSFLRLEYQPST